MSEEEFFNRIVRIIGGNRMKKLVEHKYCDKCHKETETNFCTFYSWYYDLCPKCEKQLDKMKKEIEKYQDKIDEVVKDYGFGKYLPEWEEIE